jgi:hypothetical protein
MSAILWVADDIEHTRDPVGASLLAKAYFQSPKKVAACSGPFASKVERHPGRSHRSVFSGVIEQPHRSCGSELAREAFDSGRSLGTDRRYLTFLNTNTNPTTISTIPSKLISARRLP